MKQTCAVGLVLFGALSSVVSTQAPLPTGDALISAVLANDPRAIESLLQSGVNVDVSGRIDGITLLMMAAAGSRNRPRLAREPGLSANELPPDLARDDRPVMQILLSHGANVNARDQLGKTALWWAAVFAGKVANTEFLLSHHADADAVDQNGETLLLSAISAGRDLRVVQALIAGGAEVNTRDSRGTPLLLVAVARRNLPVVGALLKAGADPKAADKDGRSALAEAIRGGQAEMTRLLLKSRADVNAQDALGDTPLVVAVRSGDAAVVQLLLEQGASLKDAPGRWAVETAAVENRISILRLLLRHGADPNARARYEPGNIPLLAIASKYRRVEPVSVLLESGADVNAVDTHGESALIRAAMERDNAAVITLLLGRGANVNARETSSGHTALILAAANGYVENVRALLDGKADRDIKTNAGATALTLATKNNHPEIVALLIARL